MKHLFLVCLMLMITTHLYSRSNKDKKDLFEARLALLKKDPCYQNTPLDRLRQVASLIFLGKQHYVDSGEIGHVVHSARTSTPPPQEQESSWLSRLLCCGSRGRRNSI